MQNEQVAVEQNDLDDLRKALEAITVEEGCTIFEHTAEEIGLLVMENHEAVLAALTARAARHRTRALEASQAGEEADNELFSSCYAAMRDAMGVIDVDEGPGLKHSKILNALADARVRIERRTERRLTTPTRIEASQPQEAVRKPWYCELPDSVHAEVTKQVREIQAIAIRLDDQKIQVVAEAVYNALIAAAALTPPQAAESGLLDERAAIVAFLREQDKLEGVTYSDYAWAADAIERGAHHPAKAGKPGEAGNG